MKKLILSVGLIVLSLNSFSQSAGLGGSSVPTAPTDNTTNPSSGFGGTLGGATVPNSGARSTPPPAGSSTLPNSQNQGTGTGYGTEQERMEDQTNFTGGSLGGGNVPPTTAPTPGNLPPRTGTGVGTEQERMEDRTNFAGGSMGGDTNVPPTTAPTPGTSPSDQPRTNPDRPNIPSATGVDSGAPTTY